MAASKDRHRGQSFNSHRSSSRILAGNQDAAWPSEDEGADPSPHNLSGADHDVNHDDNDSYFGSPAPTEPQSWDPTLGSGPTSPRAASAEGTHLDLGSAEINTNRCTTFSVNSLNIVTPPPQQAETGGFTFFSVPPSTAHPKPASPMEFVDSVQSTPAGSSQSSFSPRKMFQSQFRADQRTQPASRWTKIAGGTPPPYGDGLPRPARWWHWRPAWTMYIFLVFGCCFALGHHLFYASLNDKIADNQLAMLRYGTILAFATKASFVASVVTAFRQRLWVTLRNKLLSVGAVDALFAATDDVTALWNVETYQKAKMAMLLAAIVWYVTDLCYLLWCSSLAYHSRRLTPLVIILTSNTLLVGPYLNIHPTTCPNIRTLNFTGDELEDFRNPTIIDGRQGIALNFWNATMEKNESSPNWWDYYTGPNPYFTAAASLGIYSHQVIGAKNAALDICGMGWNCTYQVKFIGPGYNCQEIANGVGSEVQKLGNNTAPFNTSILLPEGNYSYYVQGSLGDYNPEQMANVSVGGAPKMAPPFPEHLGAFRLEPIIWAGYVVRANPDVDPPNTPSDDGWNDAFIPKIFACQNYETAYTVEFNYTGQDQYTTVVDREFLYPVMNTTYDPDTMANDGTRDNTTATPESEYVLPYPMSDTTNLRQYRRVATYHTIGAALRNAINGTILSNPVKSPNANTNALQTKVLNPRQQYFPYSNLQDLVQSLYEDIILSMFSNQGFVSLVWAAKPWEVSGDVTSDDSALYDCTKTRWENRYRYVARDLWIVYSCAFFCAAVAVIMGTFAVLENEGRLYDTRFSSIVAATRGPALEKVMWKDENRGKLAADIKNLKVGYGVIHRAPALDAMAGDVRPSVHPSTGGGEVRYGFGLEGDVRQLKREASLFRSRSGRT